MKTRKLLTTTIATIAIITTIVMSCKGIDEITEDFDIEISNNILTQEAIINIEDIVNPDKLEGTNKLTVEVLGTDSDKFVTNSGENISKLKVINGNISLAVNPNKASSEALKVLLRVSGDEYLTTTIPLVMFPEDTLVTKSINIVNKLNTVQGIDFIESTKPLTNNSLTNDYTIITPKTKATTKTEILIEEGTVFKDINGNDISGDNLTSEVAHFSLDTPESIASFPGGLQPLSVKDENGDDVEDSSFLTAGFTSIDMFVDGKEVKNFSKPISVSMEIPNDYINPETGNIIEIGDEIKIWSYDDDGQWSFHKKGIVSRNSDGNFNIVFTTTHLSWYNLDYHYWGVCNYGRKLTVSIPKVPNLADNFYQLSYELVYASNNQVIARRDIQVSKTRDIANGYYNTPNQNLKVKVYYGRYYDSNRKLLYTSEAFDGCSSNTVTISSDNISSLTTPVVKNIHIQFKARCGDKILNPFLYLWRIEPYTYYGRTYYSWRLVGYIYNGRGFIYGAKMGESQTYAAFYNGSIYYYDYTFNSDNIVIDDFDVPGDLCDRLL